MTEHRIKRRRLEMFTERGGRCCYCDGATWLVHLEPKAKARQRLGIVNAKHAAKMLRYAMATFEHIKRVADGGTGAAHNGMLACSFCNVLRGDTEIRAHRTDMQALVAAGLHPVNRPLAPVDNYAVVRKLALRAVRNLRAGQPITPAGEPQ